MKVEFLCNGWRSPVIVRELLGNEVREEVNVNTKLVATIDGTPEQIAALRTGMSRGFYPEFWGVREVEE